MLDVTFEVPEVVPLVVILFPMPIEVPFKVLFVVLLEFPLVAEVEVPFELALIRL